jgi:hypothetical protein
MPSVAYLQSQAALPELVRELHPLAITRMNEEKLVGEGEAFETMRKV